MKKILLVLLALFTPTAAWAQAAADPGVRETIPAAPFLASAYAFMWVAVLVYVGLVARRLARTQSDIEDLRRKLDRDARP